MFDFHQSWNGPASWNRLTFQIDKRIQQYVPEFFGVETITSAKDMSMIGDYLILRDIAEGFFEPNIIDVKIGAKTYGPVINLIIF